MFGSAEKFTGVGDVGAGGIEAWDTSKASLLADWTNASYYPRPLLRQPAAYAEAAATLLARLAAVPQPEVRRMVTRSRPLIDSAPCCRVAIGAPSVDCLLEKLLLRGDLDLTV